MYGSFARGDYHEESDIDLLLVVNQSMDKLASYRKSIAIIASDMSLKYDITISITVKSKQHFEQYANVLPYYQNVIKEGIRYAV